MRVLVTGMSRTGKSSALAELARSGCTHELDASRPLGEVVADLARIGSGSWH